MFFITVERVVDEQAQMDAVDRYAPSDVSSIVNYLLLWVRREVLIADERVLGANDTTRHVRVPSDVFKNTARDF